MDARAAVDARATQQVTAFFHDKLPNLSIEAAGEDDERVAMEYIGQICQQESLELEALLETIEGFFPEFGELPPAKKHAIADELQTLVSSGTKLEKGKIQAANGFFRAIPTTCEKIILSFCTVEALCTAACLSVRWAQLSREPGLWLKHTPDNLNQRIPNITAWMSYQRSVIGGVIGGAWQVGRIAPTTWPQVYRSSFRGVEFDRDRWAASNLSEARNAEAKREAVRPWRASMTSRRTALELGWFATEIEAARRVDEEALTHFGPTARLNFPERAAQGLVNAKFKGEGLKTLEETQTSSRYQKKHNHALKKAKAKAEALRRAGEQEAQVPDTRNNELVGQLPPLQAKGRNPPKT